MKTNTHPTPPRKRGRPPKRDPLIKIGACISESQANYIYGVAHAEGITQSEAVRLIISRGIEMIQAYSKHRGRGADLQALRTSLEEAFYRQEATRAVKRER